VKKHNLQNKAVNQKLERSIVKLVAIKTTKKIVEAEKNAHVKTKELKLKVLLKEQISGQHRHAEELDLEKETRCLFIELKEINPSDSEIKNQ